MIVREDFRRDGLAANFLANKELMRHAISALPMSKFNIGYPAICSSEREVCTKILESLNSDLNELCVVGHARKNQLEILAKTIEPYNNVSANSWIPISDYFLANTVNLPAEVVFKGLKELINTWKNLSDKPFDLAFADCTSPEPKLMDRISQWTEYSLNNGIRNIIICDTRGIGTSEHIEKIFDKIKPFSERIEYHAHNDNGKALETINTASNQGISTFGTSFYGAGERVSMLDPRNLLQLGLLFNQSAFIKFDKLYRQLIGNPNNLLPKLYASDVIITGSQFRLRERDQSLNMLFGVTTDTHMTSVMLGKEVSVDELAFMKDKFLYEAKKIFLTPKQLKETYFYKKGVQ